VVREVEGIEEGGVRGACTRPNCPYVLRCSHTGPGPALPAPSRATRPHPPPAPARTIHPHRQRAPLTRPRTPHPARAPQTRSFAIAFWVLLSHASKGRQTFITKLGEGRKI